ncbi:hypothetical protein SCALM49S_04793 [Streptomyces californicus]
MRGAGTRADLLGCLARGRDSPREADSPISTARTWYSTGPCP